MEYMLLLNFFISLISLGVNNIVMQRYVRQAEVPSFEIHCKELVSSLLQCAALGRASKDVRFFFSKEDSLCRWNCVLLYNGIGILGNEWCHYAIESKKITCSSTTVSASTVYENSTMKWGTQYAIDGSIGNMFHSEWEQSPWFMVTFTRRFTIQYVRIFNRQDMVGERFHDVAFEVSMDGNTFEEKGFFKGPGMTAQVIEILFDYPTIGKYLRLKITQGQLNTLHFVEIEIYTLE